MKLFDLENSPDSGIAKLTIGGDVLTVTGTGGTANVNVNGVAYLMTWATSLTVTCANWVALHKAALLLRGIKASSAAAVITIVHVRPQVITNRIWATISDASSDLASTPVATFTPDFNIARIYQLTIDCATTIAAPVNAQEGRAIRFEITASGAFGITWNTAYQFAGGTEHTQTSTALDILEGAYNAAAKKVYLTVESSDVKA